MTEPDRYGEVNNKAGAHEKEIQRDSEKKSPRSVEAIRRITFATLDRIESTASIATKFFAVSYNVASPIVSFVSIWFSVLGIALTLLSGVEPLIQLADWVRYLTLAWRELSHAAWDFLSPYLGFEIPIDLKDFSTFCVMIALALFLGLFSTGRRLIVWDTIVGIRMAVFGIAHAIAPSRQGENAYNRTTQLNLLFFEIDQFISRNYRSSLAESLPILVILNISFRTFLIFVPMVILVPESTLSETFNIRATRAEYLVTSLAFSYSAAVVVLSSGILHIIIHIIRSCFTFLYRIAFKKPAGDQRSWIARKLSDAFRNSRFLLTFKSRNSHRSQWSDQHFLTRLFASVIWSNWVLLPISTAERWHRRYDPFLFISERRFADAAFIDRITKGLFVFFLIYAMNWISINGENIRTLFSAPV
jgi:hypothetical protein